MHAFIFSMDTIKVKYCGNMTFCHADEERKRMRCHHHSFDQTQQNIRRKVI